MQTYSNLDLIFFFVCMDYEYDADGNLADVLEFAGISQGESFEPISKNLDWSQHTTHFHETYHFWQGLRLPFLNRYATLAFAQIFYAFRQLSKQSEDFHQWRCFNLGFERLNLESKIGFKSDGHLFWSNIESNFPPETKNELKINLIDFLECATSLAEFQVVSYYNDRVDTKLFNRWCKRNPAHRALFDFVAKFLDNESLALRALLPLINTSFYTTMPERAFVELLGRLWGISRTKDFDVFLSQKEPCRWTELFHKWLSEIHFSISDGEERLVESSFYALPSSKYLPTYFVHKNISVMHPFLGVLTQKWNEMQKNNPGMLWFLDLPGYIGETDFHIILHAFAPPLTLNRFRSVNGDYKFLLQGYSHLKIPSIYTNDNDKDYRGFIADLLTMYSVVRRASGQHFYAKYRTCNHKMCEQYELNYCSLYPVIPRNFRDCGFVNRVRRMIKEWGGENGYN